MYKMQGLVVACWTRVQFHRAAFQANIAEHVLLSRNESSHKLCVATYMYSRRFHKELGLVLSPVRTSNSSYLTRPNLGLILRSACYSAGLGLVPSPKDKS